MSNQKARDRTSSISSRERDLSFDFDLQKDQGPPLIMMNPDMDGRFTPLSIGSSGEKKYLTGGDINDALMRNRVRSSSFQIENLDMSFVSNMMGGSRGNSRSGSFDLQNIDFSGFRSSRGNSFDIPDLSSSNPSNFYDSKYGSLQFGSSIPFKDGGMYYQNFEGGGFAEGGVFSRSRTNSIDLNSRLLDNPHNSLHLQGENSYLDNYLSNNSYDPSNILGGGHNSIIYDGDDLSKVKNIKNKSKKTKRGSQDDIDQSSSKIGMNGGVIHSNSHASYATATGHILSDGTSQYASDLYGNAPLVGNAYYVQSTGGMQNNYGVYRRTGSVHCHSDNPNNGYVGTYSPVERRKRIDKFLDKRSRRVWTKKVKYDVRKNFADSRLRIKGRFVKKEEESVMRSSGILNT